MLWILKPLFKQTAIPRSVLLGAFLGAALFSVWVETAEAMQIETITYTGNGADDRSITGCGFQPDAVIIKKQGFGAGATGVIRSADMSGDVSKPLSTATVFTANLIQAIEADGFQVGTHISVNENTSVYHAMCLKGHANDLKVGTYTGNGVDDRSITGVGFQPEAVIVWADNADHAVIRTTANSGDDTSRFDGSDLAAVTNQIQVLEADGFQVGTSARVNTDTETYYYVAWKSVAGFAKVGSYTGNGVDDRSITGVGFQPDNVGVHDVDGSRGTPTWRPSTLAGDLTLQWGASGAVANMIQALEADGFQVGADGIVNSNTQTYGYWAFKDGDSQPNTTPADPTSLTQLKSDDATTISNEGYTDETEVNLKASATDADTTEILTLFFELVANADSFTSEATPTVGGSCASGTAYADCASKMWYITSASGDYSSTAFTATSTVATLTDATGYKWQAKACDDESACSDWVAFNATTPNFTIDTTAPTVSTLSPADNATGVATNANLVITFSEAVDVETGNITIKKTSDDSTVEAIDVAGGLVTGTGTDTITVNPTSDLDEQIEYYVLIDATAFDDAAGNSYAGISSTTAWSFTTADETNPTADTLSPLDNATGVATNANLVITFSEAVDVETGNITIKKTSDDSTVEAIDVTGGLVTGTGTDTITVNPTSDLDEQIEYYVLIDATAFDDASGNSYAGIAGTTAWSFTTEGVTPAASGSSTGGGTSGSAAAGTAWLQEQGFLPSPPAPEPPPPSKPDFFVPEVGLQPPPPSLIERIIPPIFRPAPPPEPPELPPVTPEELPEETPLAFQGQWQFITYTIENKPLVRFTLAPLPGGIVSLKDKFPQLAQTLEQVGVTKITDLQRLRAVRLTLPGLGEIGRDIPTEVVFTRYKSAPGIKPVDIPATLTVTDQGEPQQQIRAIAGKPLHLTVKPEQPATNIKGYLVFRSRTSSVTEGIPMNALLASAAFSESALAQVYDPEDVETRLVLLEFDYIGPDEQGLWTADIQAPAVEGEYEVLTVIEYEDPELGTRAIRLVTVVDPEGYVYERSGGRETRIPGAVVSLYWWNAQASQYELWGAKDYQQENPQLTDITGRYSFLVPQGSYYLLVEAPGYLIHQGKVFQVQEGAGVHTNIELKASNWWLKVVDWKTAVLIGVVLLLLLNFWRDRMRKRQN